MATGRSEKVGSLVLYEVIHEYREKKKKQRGTIQLLSAKEAELQQATHAGARKRVSHSRNGGHATTRTQKGGVKLTAENRAIKHHLSSGDAERQRKEEISEQLYLFGGSAFDFPAVQELQQESPAAERLCAACQYLHTQDKAKQPVLRLQGSMETFFFPASRGQQSSEGKASSVPRSKKNTLQ